jgi:hypothetical protein
VYRKRYPLSHPYRKTSGQQRSKLEKIASFTIFLLLISQKTLSASNCYTPPQKNRLLSKINYGQEKSERAFPLYRFSSLHGENGIEDG